MSMDALGKALDWIVKFLIVCISAWIIFYAFGKQLYDLLGNDLYISVTAWIYRLITLGVVLLIIFAGWYLYKVKSENK